MNRFVNLTPARFNPMSWEEIASVPLAKRQQHDATQQAMADMETTLAQIKSLEPHTPEAKAMQDYYRNEISNLAGELSARGVSGDIRDRILQLNSKYKADLSPQGRLGQIQNAYDLRQKQDAEFLSTADKKHSREKVQQQLALHNQSYEGYGPNNEILNPTAGGMISYTDVPKYIEDRLSSIQSNITKTLGSEYYLDNIDGVLGIRHKTTGEQVKTNNPQLQSAINQLKNELSDTNTELGQFVKMYGYDKNLDQRILNASGKYNINDNLEILDDNFQMLPGQFTKDGKPYKPKKPDLFTSESIFTNQPLTSYKDYLKKQSNINNKLYGTEPLTPNEKNSLIVQKRHNNRLYNKALLELENNKLYTEKRDKIKNVIDSYSINPEITQWESLGGIYTLTDYQNKRYGKKGETYYDSSDGMLFSDLPENVQNYIKATAELNDLNEKYLTPTIKRMSNDVTAIDYNPEDPKDKKDFMFDIQNKVSNDSFKPSAIYVKDEKLNLNENESREAISIIKNTKPVDLRLYTDPSLGQAGYLLTTQVEKDEETIGNTTYKKGETIEYFLPIDKLYDSNTGLPHRMSTYLNKLPYGYGVRKQMENQIALGSLSPTTDYNKLGERLVTEEESNYIFGNNFTKKVFNDYSNIKGFDFYEDLNTGLVQMWGITENDQKIQPTFGSAYDLNDVYDDINKLVDGGVINDIVYLTKTIKTGNNTVYEESGLKEYIENKNLTTEQKDKLIKQSFEYIKKLPLSFKNINNFLNLNNLYNE